MKLSSGIGSKNRYATSFVAMYKLGLLDRAVVAAIPRNTLYYWDTRVDLENFIGFELDHSWEQQKEFLNLMMKHRAYCQLCKNMFVLFNCFKDIVFASKQSKKLLRKHKDSIIVAYDYVCRFSSKKLVSKFIGIPHQRISSWKNVSSCSKSVLNRCLFSHPLQLSVNEVAVFKKFLFDERFASLPLSYRWAQLIRLSSVVICLSTFYKYASAILGVSVRYLKPVSHVVSPKAFAPFQVLHMDSTVVRDSDGSLIYIHFIMDNFSKAILSAHASFSARSAGVALNLKGVLERYNLTFSDVQVCCDDGPENNGEVNHLLAGLQVQKVIATFKHNSTNNLIEAFNKKFKCFVINGVCFDSIGELEVLLPGLVDYYNGLFQPSMGCCSPNEVLAGVVPLKLDLAEAKLIRRLENRVGCCEV